MTEAEPLTRILIVEDDPATSEFFVDLLDLSGYQALVSATGSAALGLLAEHRIHLVMLDLRLPDMSGLELCQHIRAVTQAHLPILLLTADHNPELTKRAKQVGITAHLKKPVDADQLLEQIDRLLLPAAQNEHSDAHAE
jgi:DNA-binding response OmpR family regulator